MRFPTDTKYPDRKPFYVGSPTPLLMSDCLAYNQLPACPVEVMLTVIGNKWKVLIIRDLMTGTKRFGELKSSVGDISQKVLSSNLKSMEAEGFLERRSYNEIPPRVEYTLTDLGRSLSPVLESMVEWGEVYREYVRTSEEGQPSSGGGSADA